MSDDASSNTDTANEDSFASSQNGDHGATGLKDISFGALARAQDHLPNHRKRKLDHQDDAEAQFDGARRKGRLELSDERSTIPPKRSSKHAPTIQSSRKAVSRSRIIFSTPPSLKPRDPRFDPTVNASTQASVTARDSANRNYSFLTSYRASEILELKSQIKKSKDPELIAKLKQQLMSLSSKMQAAEMKQKEKDILMRHKQKEKEAIRAGRKSQPYFLKKNDVRKEILKERFENMGKKARDKAMARKRKRSKAKEAKEMPRHRRAVKEVTSLRGQ